jgi:PHS family inorganic phosphate transporter-like MFS transporter
MIALAFRFTIPESPRYKLDILRNVHMVFEDTKDYFGGPGVDAEGGELEMLPTSPTVDGHGLSRISTSSEIAPDEVVDSDSESERRPSSLHQRPTSYQHVQLPPDNPSYSE